MAYHTVMAYIGWAANVNKIILDSTNVTVGENATVKDSLESGGQSKIRLKCANPPDKYSVVMNFDFVTKGDDGLTELERFYAWYKWAHCYGANPFEFPAILINSNRKEGLAPSEQTSDETPDLEFYCITSAVEGSKSGLCQQISMTWETYATGVLTIPDESATLDHIAAENGYVDLFFTANLTTEPSTNTYPVMINSTRETINSLTFDGDAVRYFFTPKTAQGIYRVNVNGLEDIFTVGV